MELGSVSKFYAKTSLWHTSIEMGCHVTKMIWKGPVFKNVDMVVKSAINGNSGELRTM